MPHGISGFRARRLAREIEKFWTGVSRHLHSVPDSQLDAERAKFEGLTIVGSTDLQAYLLGRPNDRFVPFGGRVRIPDKESIIREAKAFGRAMNKPELLELAAAVRQRGL